ncbi:MAG: PadR family transcriptional regulator [Candidatus Hodarchaeales archaeon]
MKYDYELQKWETEFKKGFSKPLILLNLADHPNYPYQVTKTISEKTKGKITIAGSNIYPILKKIEDDGLIAGKKDEDSKKRVYTLTHDGTEFLASLKHSMKDFIEIIQEMIEAHGEV